MQSVIKSASASCAPTSFPCVRMRRSPRFHPLCARGARSPPSPPAAQAVFGAWWLVFGDVAEALDAPLLLLTLVLTALLCVGSARRLLAAVALRAPRVRPRPVRREDDIEWYDVAASVLHYAGCSLTLSHFFSPLLYRLSALAGCLRLAEHFLPAQAYKGIVEGFAALRGNTVAGSASARDRAAARRALTARHGRVCVHAAAARPDAHAALSLPTRQSSSRRQPSFTRT